MPAFDGPTPALSRTRIKICGITRNEDALLAARLGADAIGLVFHPASPRAVEPAQVPDLLAGLPPFVTVVGLLVDPDPQQVRAVLASGLVNCLQFHGNESVRMVQTFAVPRIKAIRIRDEDSLEQLVPFKGVASVLLDTWDAHAAGGTGRSFDWSIARKAVERGHDNLVLAGGLNPDNVAEAIIQVRPWGVDVSSGVETAPGLKDSEKMRRFIAAVTQANKRR